MDVIGFWCELNTDTAHDKDIGLMQTKTYNIVKEIVQ